MKDRRLRLINVCTNTCNKKVVFVEQMYLCMYIEGDCTAQLVHRWLDSLSTRVETLNMILEY